MSLFKIFDVAGSAMLAQSQRLNVTASNLANADSAAGPNGRPYQARQVLFETVAVGQPIAAASGLLPVQAPTVPGTTGYVISSTGEATGVRVAGVRIDESPGRRVYDPKHPLADPSGHVTMPNVNVVEEMVNMISASRSYQTNAEVMNTAKSMLMRTLQLMGQ